MPEPLLTAQEVAQMAGVKSVSTVSGWVRAGKLKRAEGGGNARERALYRQSDVEAFLAANDILSRNGKTAPTKTKAPVTPEDTIRQSLVDMTAEFGRVIKGIERALDRMEADVRQRIAQDVLGKTKKGGSRKGR